MACDVGVLLNESSCYQCLAPSQRQLVGLALLCRISTGVTTACDVATLLNEASCFACLSPGERDVAELGLLCNIAT